MTDAAAPTPSPDPDAPGRLAVLIAYTGEGGVEKMVNQLLGGLSELGESVDVLMLKARGAHAKALLDAPPPGVRVHRLDAATSLSALPAIVRYLRDHRPRALLAAKDRAGRVAILARAWARRRYGVETRIVLRMGMHLSASLAGKTAVQRLARYLPVRALYGRADRIITVTDAVGDDLAAIGRLPRSHFVTVPNPVITDALFARADAPLAHPWLTAAAPRPPVLVAAGRFRPQKGFDTLLRALARLHTVQPGSHPGRAGDGARLVLLGDGPDWARLEALASELGVADAVDFVGFQTNPYPWMRAADAFVLSSRFEGSPNVLTEAMALGTPVVATDCLSGPRDLLAEGRWGPLVPVDDDQALADGIRTVLASPPERATLQRAVAHYQAAESARRYRDVLDRC